MLIPESSPCNTVLTHNYSDQFWQFEDCELTANVFFNNKNTYFHEFIDGILEKNSKTVGLISSENWYGAR